MSYALLWYSTVNCEELEFNQTPQASGWDVGERWGDFSFENCWSSLESYRWLIWLDPSMTHQSTQKEGDSEPLCSLVHDTIPSNNASPIVGIAFLPIENP